MPRTAVSYLVRKGRNDIINLALSLNSENKSRRYAKDKWIQPMLRLPRLLGCPINGKTIGRMIKERPLGVPDQVARNLYLGRDPSQP